MSLVLEIEFLLGTCFAAVGPDSDLPDWPPQPDRVFSALVSTWGAHSENKEEARALEWLEEQPAPRIESSEQTPRSAATVFVPPNDPETKRAADKTVLPAYRRRQSRRFPAARPHLPVVRLYWPTSIPDDQTLAALILLAADTAYVGHSASLTRCVFRRTADTPSNTTVPKRRVYPGRLAELQRSYEMFVASAGGKGRPLPGARVNPVPQTQEAFPRAFEDRWLLLEIAPDRVPDIRATTILSKAIRDALLAGYQRVGRGNAIPEVVSGHAADGTPTRIPHIAIVPLAFVGFPHADGHLMAFALLPPCDCAILDDATFRQALRTLSPVDEMRGRRVLTVRPKAGSGAENSFSLELFPTFEPPAGKRSLDPSFYTKPSRTFASVTPIVLDRHLKEKGAAQIDEIAGQIAMGCRNIGLPEPEIVIPDKHSAIEGATSAYPSGKSPDWLHWRLPPAMRSRPLTHAVIRFREPVQGPVLLCAGRFIGLGLCRPTFDRELET